MLIFGLRLPVLIFADASCVMADHHFKEQAKNGSQTEKVRGRCNQIQRNRLLVIHDIVDTKVTDRRIHRENRIKVLFKGCIGRRYDTAKLIIRLF